MIRRLIALALSLCLVGGSAEAAGLGKLLRIKHGVSVAPTIPSVIPGSGWTGFFGQPASQGNPADYGYADQAVARFDQPPFQTLNAGQSLTFTVVAYHQPTASDYAGGITSNIASVDCQAEGGSVATVRTATTNPSTGSVGYVFKVNANDFATDGQKEVRCVAYPSTGAPIVLQGPSTGVALHNGSISGTTLTIDAPSGTGTIQLGQSVLCFDCTNGTIITGLISGTGGAGTYTVSISQTVATQKMALDGTAGLTFSTNKTGSLSATVRYTSNAGSDVTSCGITSAAPCLTWSKAMTDIGVAQSGDFSGGIVCSQAGSYSYGNATENFNRPALTRWPVIQPTNIAPCDGVNAGTVTMTSNGSTAGMRISKMHLNHITISGPLPSSTASAGGDPTVWFDTIAYVGQGPTLTNFFGPYSGGTYWTDSTLSNTQNGAIGSEMVRNVTESALAQDGFTNSRLVINATVTNMSAFLALGDIASGSPIILNVTDTSRMVVGGYVNTGGPAAQFPNGTTVVSIVGSTVTLSGNSASTFTSAQIWAGAGAGTANSHGDVYATDGLGANFIVQNLQAGDGSNFAQGVFTDGASLLKGGVIVNSSFQASAAWQAIGGVTMQLNSPASNVLWLGNSWPSGNMLFRSTAVDFSVINNTCGVATGPLTGVVYRGSPSCQ